MRAAYIILVVVVVAAAGCAGHKEDANLLYNRDASIRAADSLAFNPLEWTVISTVMDKKNNTMSTLYGNEAAASYSRSGQTGAYPADAKLALVTWKQVADPHWFGANIAGRVQSVETIIFDSTAGKNSIAAYQRYEGSPLRPAGTIDGQAISREKFILGLRAPIIP